MTPIEKFVETKGSFDSEETHFHARRTTLAQFVLRYEMPKVLNMNFKRPLMKEDAQGSMKSSRSSRLTTIVKACDYFIGFVSAGKNGDSGLRVGSGQHIVKMCNYIYA